MRLYFSFLVSLLLLAGSAQAAPKLVSVESFHPTQMQIGKKAADFHVRFWRAEAKAKGMTLKTYAKEVLQPKFAAQKLPAIIDPQGEYRNTDGHHRITALRKVTALTGVEFSVEVDLLASYRGKSQAAYAKDFIGRLGKGQFTKEVEALPPAERMKHLPATYADLGDSPMRTAMEIVFSRNNIKGSLMRDYIEFRAGQRLVDGGLLDQLKREGIVSAGAHTLPGKLAEDPRVLAVIEKALTQKPMRHYLLSEAVGDKAREELKDSLHAMRN